jgi:hypothetical protein
MRLRIYTVSALAAALVTCGGNPPQAPSTPPQTPSPPRATGMLTSLKLTGPTTIAPGATAQFTATGQMSDGATQDYTTKVTWYCAYPAVLSISSSGLATGQSPGDAQVQAILPGLIARADVLVVPAGTFRLIGTVTEAGLPVWDATVSVIAGQGTGASTVTLSDGTFRLYGVAGPIQVQVSKRGYLADVKTIAVTTNDILDFPDFRQPDTAPTIAGSYTFTLQASNDCEAPFSLGPTTYAPLPVGDRIRTYSAKLTQTGPRIHVALGGAAFFLHDGYGDYFDGRFDPDGLFFALGSPYYYRLTGPDLVERLSSERVLAMDGWARGAMSAGGTFHAAFEGTLTEFPLLPSGLLGDFVNLCHSQNHQFTLTPVTTAATRRR